MEVGVAVCLRKRSRKSLVSATAHYMYVYACNNERMCTVELFCVYMLMCVCHNFPSINPVCMRVCGGEWVGEWV